MAVRARFYVAEHTRFANGATRPGFSDPAPMGSVVLRPVVRGETNKQWASATPNGRIEMTVNGPAMTWFEQHLGTEVAITFDDVTED